MSAPAPKRNPAQPRDVMTIGPGFKVMMYYKDGDSVVVRTCKIDKEKPKVPKTRDNCIVDGRENRVPVGVFKRSLAASLIIGDQDKFKSISSEELEALKKSDPTKYQALKDQETQLDEKLKAVEEFIRDAGGADKATQATKKDTETLLSQVRAELTSGKLGEGAIKKVNNLINDLVDKKIASKEVHVVSNVKDDDQDTYAVLSRYDSSKPECGTDEVLNGTPSIAPPSNTPTNGVKGGWLREFFWVKPAFAKDVNPKLEARIKDCAHTPGSMKTSKGVEWNLVTRKRDKDTGRIYETWTDSKTGKVWSEPLDKLYTHNNAVKLGKKDRVIEETACDSEDGKRARAGVNEKTFGMPNIQEFEEAEKNGIRDIVPGMSNRWFWSASLSPKGSDYARGFSGNGGYSSDDYYRDGGFSVLCVGR